jgi:hypothetical protein
MPPPMLAWDKRGPPFPILQQKSAISNGANQKNTPPEMNWQD